MIEFDQVRSAVFSPEPWTELDLLVRAEQAAGRKVNEIRAELEAMIVPVSELPGISENGEDAFGDTMDALRGWCHPKCRYTDPPNTSSLPSEEEIALLPRWAQVAFAVRCAKRARMIYPPNHFPLNNQTPAERALSAAEKSGAMAEMPENAQLLLDEIKSSHGSMTLVTGQRQYSSISSAMHALEAAASHDKLTKSTSLAMTTAIRSLVLQNWMCDPKNETMTSYLSYPNQIGNSVDPENSIIGKHSIQMIKLCRSDFEQLMAIATWQHWTDDTAVPPTVFGPLWPDGLPANWSVNPELPNLKDIAFGLAVKDGISDRIIEDEVVNLFNTINRYYIARGGKPLDLEDFQPFVSALQLAEV